MGSSRKWTQFMKFWHEELRLPTNTNCSDFKCTFIKQIYDKINEIRRGEKK
jgi:hypothetical protein